MAVGDSDRQVRLAGPEGPHRISRPLAHELGRVAAQELQGIELEGEVRTHSMSENGSGPFYRALDAGSADRPPPRRSAWEEVARTGLRPRRAFAVGIQPAQWQVQARSMHRDQGGHACTLR